MQGFVYQFLRGSVRPKVELMARSDLLLSIVRAGAEGDQATLRASVEALVAEEKSKQHNILADRLQRVINSVPAVGKLEARQPLAPGRDIILETIPQRQLSELILPLPVTQQVRNLVEEQSRADLLRSHGVQPRHTMLLSGPPGNGKTSVAEAIAEALALPLFTVRYDALVGSYLGETNTRLRKLFDYVRTTACVLFFDEFDAIGKERGDTHETGEIKRVVSFLLMQIDQLPSYVVAVAATNHHALLDSAVWRRFQMRLHVPQPDWRQVAVLIARYFDTWDEKLSISPEALAKQLEPASFAEIVEFCQTVRRGHILSAGSRSLETIIRQETQHWSERVGQTTSAGRSNKADPQARQSRGKRQATGSRKR
ncbi:MULTISPECIES: ATP-binding protein [unclassified Mesorhizobium]|uniref:AAA family ATPase n=2 Tax=Mesorhizobium TaxID=68287 RepID=UPI001CCDBF06|nr:MULTISPECIES: ATP-binding protein [unclassified Mesorhizobium]MBZ9701964.1 ATP-binding protein [Mesorhizobium sp. CO1-1-3]MBZ9945396.1 ATP-binding protein [Mesorhizobium sp. BR1-1-11]